MDLNEKREIKENAEKKDEKKDEKNSENKFQDGKWGILVLFASFAVHFIMDGFTYSLGTYVKTFSKDFESPLTSVTFILSLLPASTLLMGI